MKRWLELAFDSSVFLKLFRLLGTMGKALLAIIFIAIGFSASAQDTADTPVGLWRTIDDQTGQAKAEIRIRANSQGLLTGVVEKSLVINPKPICTECSDDRKDKLKLGMEVIRDIQKAQAPDVWDGGKILDPESGRAYTLRLRPIDGGTRLEVRVSLGPFSRTQTWLRIQPAAPTYRAQVN